MIWGRYRQCLALDYTHACSFCEIYLLIPMICVCLLYFNKRFVKIMFSLQSHLMYMPSFSHFYELPTQDRKGESTSVYANNNWGTSGLDNHSPDGSQVHPEPWLLTPYPARSNRITGSYLLFSWSSCSSVFLHVFTDS